MEEHRLAMEERIIVDTLKGLFPAREGWIILPGVKPTAPIPDSLHVWFESPRIVQPDTLEPGIWARFLTKPGEVRFDAVSGYLRSPRSSTPAGFMGLLVTFQVQGINAAAIVLNGTQMRWLAWWEHAQASVEDSLHEARIDSIGLMISRWLGTEQRNRHGAVECDSILSRLGFFPPIPRHEIEPAVLWEHAQSHAKPQLKGLGDQYVVIPDIITGPQIRAAVPRTVLENQEPFLLQRRLDVAERAGWPGFNVVKNDVRLLSTGEYIWVAGPYGQVRAVGVERGSETPELTVGIGPSILFFGRPVFGAGLLVVVDDDGDGRVDEASAFPQEYGMSPYSRESLITARRSGEELFLRIGYLLDTLPGPRESERWPALQTLPASSPWGPWRPVIRALRFVSDEGFDLFSDEAP
jgi:hypothetical protein